MDAIQSLTGCTFGKGNLHHRDYGKNAFTFFRRSDGRALRVASRPEAWGPRDPEREALSARARSGNATEAERRQFQAYQAERSERILDAPLEQLFRVEPVPSAPPRKARLHRSLVCDTCREQAMETRVRHFDGKTLCIPCFEQVEPRL